MNLKRFVYKHLFTEEQRKAIWKAILFSHHTYHRRGEVERAKKAILLIKDVMSIAEEDVRLKRKKKRCNGNDLKIRFVRGMIIDKEKCEKCKYKDDCFVKNTIDEVERENFKDEGSKD